MYFGSSSLSAGRSLHRCREMKSVCDVELAEAQRVKVVKTMDRVYGRGFRQKYDVTFARGARHPPELGADSFRSFTVAITLVAFVLKSFIFLVQDLWGCRFSVQNFWSLAGNF